MSVIIPPPEPNTIALAPGAGGGQAGPFNETGLPFTNPTTAGLTYIGNVSQEWIADLPIFETPFASDPKEYVYRLLYKVKASAFVSMPLYQAGPYGGIHIGESNFRTSIGGILSFYREFARKPDSRNEFESYVYTYTYWEIKFPTVTIALSDFVEQPKTVTSRVQYDYFETNQPSTIPLPRAPRLVRVTAGSFYPIGDYFSLTEGDQFLAEDATLRQWKGKIYERMMRFVEWRNFTTE